MTERILDLSDTPARLRSDTGRLVVERPETEALFVPFGELAAVILAHPRISITQAALHQLSAANVCLITCAADRTPSGMLLPLVGHSTQTERFARQAAAGRPLRKRLWKQVVQAKLRAQGRLLERVRGTDAGLAALSRRVRSGDPENREAEGARRYWPVLFPGGGFRRSRFGGDLNPHLNYGYAVLRSQCARGLAGVGLHPSLGLHHHNRYDAFSLASDMMEPFRPIVDGAVVSLDVPSASAHVLNRQQKAVILTALTSRYEAQGESRRLSDWLGRAASSLARIFMGHASVLDLPEFRP